MATSSGPHHTVQHSLELGLQFLAQEIQTNGSFISLSADNPKNFKKALKFHSLFSTALILECLTQTKIKTPLLRKIAQFLLEQKSAHWTFNYWDRNSSEFKEFPYPDDLDDTFCSLAALYHYDPSVLDGEALAEIVNILTTLETAEGGPYTTWLVSKTADKKWRDVDVVVNSNIAYFLSLQKVSLPNVIQFIDEKIVKKKLSSPYYPELIPIIYFVSRNYKGEYAERLAEQLLKAQLKKGIWENPLFTAMASLALHNLGETHPDAEASLNSLLKQQNKSGSWPVAPIYTGVNPKYHQQFFAGSEAVSTAFCLQALTHLQPLIEKNPPQKDLAAIETYKKINKRIEQKLSQLPSELKEATTTSLKTILQEKNKQQVMLLPYFFKQALGKKAANIPNELIYQLGEANLYGWIAYTIYDDFLDDENHPALLPLANFFLRELTTIFTHILPDTNFRNVFYTVMNLLENANTWEVKNCRIKIKDQKLMLSGFKLPDYGHLRHLADRSLGHALSPLALVLALGYQETDDEFKHIFAFFKHYLIARQLNDDVHDWEQDLMMGHVNVIGEMILKKAKLKKELPLTQLAEKLQPIFWNEVVVEACDLVFDHVHKAEEALRKTTVIAEPALLQSLLTKYHTAAETALVERQKALGFLKAYR